jgi:hypothetical protein
MRKRSNRQGAKVAKKSLDTKDTKDTKDTGHEGRTGQQLNRQDRQEIQTPLELLAVEPRTELAVTDSGAGIPVARPIPTLAQFLGALRVWI